MLCVRVCVLLMYVSEGMCVLQHVWKPEENLGAGSPFLLTGDRVFVLC